MGLKDLIVTPLLLIICILIATMIKARMKDKRLSGFLLTGFAVKLFGAILLGFIYQFYYDGGDTFNFWTHGSSHIWDAFLHSPIQGLQMIFGDIRDPKHFEYFSQIWLRRSDSSLFVIRLAGFIDIFTIHTYSATALIFGILSMIGSWMLFTTLYRISYINPKLLFTVIFLIPSTVIWGSGLLKDSITLSALFVCIAILIKLIELKEIKLSNFLILLVGLFMLFKIKVYILICLIPCACIWIYLQNISIIKSRLVKLMAVPFLLLAFGIMGFQGAVIAGSESTRYAISDIPKLSRITAYDLSKGWGKDAGSTYFLGELDDTWQTMLSMSHKAINVSLFRPYLWESSNVLMVLTSLESLLLLALSLIFLFRIFSGKVRINRLSLIFLLFSITFAFAIGISTYNFGTLSRYRIPILSLYCLGILMSYYPTKTTINKNTHARLE